MVATALYPDLFTLVFVTSKMKLHVSASATVRNHRPQSDWTVDMVIFQESSPKLYRHLKPLLQVSIWSSGVSHMWCFTRLSPTAG